MKKYVLLLLCAMLLCPYVGAQTFKRTTKTPSFFVPKGALQTGNRRENLVPVEEMRYQGQQAPIVVEMQRLAREKAQKEAQEKITAQTIERLRKEHENTHKNQAVAKENESRLANQQGEQKTQHIETAAKNINVANLKSAENKRLRSIEEPTISEADEEVFVQIISEYHHDVAAASKGNTRLNKRMLEMVADYKNQEHEI